MSRKRARPEEIVAKLRQVDVFGLPPEKWSFLRYGSRELKEDVSDVEEEAQV